MICAVFGDNRVTLRGHADYAPRGEDIVCAAASALVFALIGALEEKGQLKELVIRPGLVTVAAEGDCRAEWQVIRYGLENIRRAFAWRREHRGSWPTTERSRYAGSIGAAGAADPAGGPGAGRNTHGRYGSRRRGAAGGL